MVEYFSTRSNKERIPAALAIVKGIADDGGLYVPSVIPKLDKDLAELCRYSYQELAAYVLSKYLSDFTADEISYCVNNAYNELKFDKDIVKLHSCDKMKYLELYHGRTIAFKDMALSILPYLMKVSAKKCNVNEEIAILTATSGDTGKAALEGFADVDGIRIVVFYPKGGVSRIQELQMITQKGRNVSVVAVNGNFDDAQNAVKYVLSNDEIKKELLGRGYILSSANSINIGRLVPQIVYYIYSYLRLLSDNRIQPDERINIAVPTGNFGNVLAAYYAKEMGLPVGKLVCASNINNVLTDFMQSGIYDRNREFHLTISPSMDILISSNLERLLYHLSGGNCEYVASCMAELGRTGKYALTDDIRSRLEAFEGGYADEEATRAEITEVYSKYNYVIDTHTAVASAVYSTYAADKADEAVAVIASTASPYKFLKDVYPAVLGSLPDMDDLALAEEFEKRTGLAVPYAVSSLKTAEILHNTVIDKDKISDYVMDYLK